MLGWSTNLFRVSGIQLSLHFSFYLLLGFNAWQGWRESGWAGLWWHSGLLIAFFVCVVLHELGHCFTARRYGIGVSRILLLPIGGVAEFDGIPREPRREVLISLAGPAVNFVLAAALWLLLRMLPPPVGALDAAGDTLPGLAASLDLLLAWNLLMGIFNLVPAFPMDGGRVLRALLAERMDYLRATFWAATVGKGVAIAGAVAAYFYQPLAILLFLFVFIVGELEYRGARRRAAEEEHFRATVERLRAQSIAQGTRPPI
jgi:Zn-dependent protease